MAAQTTIKHKRKAGAFSGGELAAGEIGVDVSAGAAYLSTSGSDAVKVGGSTVDVAILEDQKSSGTDGGTFTSGAWQTRDLNTEVVDGGSFVSLASNVFTLDAGKYLIEASCPASFVGRHQARLVSGGSVVAYGTTQIEFRSGSSTSNTVANSRSLIAVVVDIGSSTAYSLEHQCAITYATFGFGLAAGFGTEVYSVVKITKLG